MIIKKVLCSKAMTGFYMDDKEAIKRGAEEDGFVYKGDPVTPGFHSIRQPGVAVSVMFVLEDGQIAFGDCAVAQYAASGGREVPNTAEALIKVIEKYVVPYFEGMDLTEFKSTAERFDRYEFDGERLPASIRYGVTQAILEAVAKMEKTTMAEVVLKEYHLPVDLTPVRINAQSGDDRYNNVDKMILKKVGMMPHGLINNVKSKLGEDGQIFLDWVKWVKNRIVQIGEPDYNPVMRYDVYGCMGYAFHDDLDQVFEYLLKVEDACKPYQVFVEMPIDLKSNEKQKDGFLYLKKRLKEAGSTLKLIIDEYANTYEEIKEWVDAGACDMVQVKTIDLGGINNIIDAVLYCKEHGVLAYQGGTCNETDHSALVCVNLAVATKPFAMAGKPGMGVDEGVMIVNNEQQRLLKILEAKQNHII
ncbi:methylaspartate ammonia-lyase [Cuneatibacter sp. NSJ-177]|uniref:methylaspartate ammonia-lyase n=1 Tax=Cuneatibacter sp. NSJ-177 TaxID=2931401 RepID=UPI001FD35CEE|nr:methylaspartate ammonia-lyase [Cuneatibacter sp. NSJ-177]MCJ7837532.1 methylaspartate ammonia-lyase [Cuneatibacter sp. NSJ-177]